MLSLGSLPSAVSSLATLTDETPRMPAPTPPSSAPSSQLSASTLRAAALSHGGYALASLNVTLHLDGAAACGGGAAFLSALAPYTSLRALWLRGIGATTLVPPETGWPPLTALYAADNSLGGDGAAAPLSWLCSNGGPPLRILDLGGNMLETLAPLGDALAAATLTVGVHGWPSYPRAVQAGCFRRRRRANTSPTHPPTPHPPLPQTLLAGGNRLRALTGLTDLRRLPRLETLDLRDNCLAEPALLDLLAALPALRVLYLRGNAVVAAIAHYRRAVVARCVALEYLDERPVFPGERDRAAAWLAAAGGGVAAADAAERAVVQRLAREEDGAEARRARGYDAIVRASSGPPGSPLPPASTPW